MSFLLVAALLGSIATMPPAVTAAAQSSSSVAGAGDTWDLENDSCGHHLVYRGNVVETVDEIDFHVTNNNSDTPIARVEIFTGRRGDGGDHDCDDSATAPAGWLGQVQTDGRVVFVAQSPSDVIEAGGRLFGFKVGHRGGSNCCRRHRGFGPGLSSIHDDDDDHEDCSCSQVAVAPTSWSGAKVLYR